MRKLLIAAFTLAGLAGGAASAQVVTSGGPLRGGVAVGGDPRTWGPGNQPVVQPVPGPGWGGGYVGGQWVAGTRAPGGWNAYRRPQRGWQMPGYWRSPDYRIQNYAVFGLAAPPQGYGWSRYYDDAVLVDYDGRVYDSVSGLDWRRVDQTYSTGYGYPSQGYWNSPNDQYGYGAHGGQAYAGGGYAYAQGGQGGQVIYAPPQQVVQYGYGYQGGYAPGSSATATVEFDQRAPETTTTTTTTTTTEEWVSQPVVTYAPVTERVIYKQGPTRVIYKQAPPKVVYRTVVKKVPVYRAPVKRWRPKPQPACADQCECGVVCGS